MHYLSRSKRGFWNYPCVVVIHKIEILFRKKALTGILDNQAEKDVR